MSGTGGTANDVCAIESRVWSRGFFFTRFNLANLLFCVRLPLPLSLVCAYIYTSIPYSGIPRASAASYDGRNFRSRRGVFRHWNDSFADSPHFTLNRILYFQSLEDIHFWSPLHNKGRKRCNVSTKKCERKVLTERWLYPPRLFTKKGTLTDAFFPAP